MAGSLLAPLIGGTAASIAAPALLGAGVGAAGSAITGGDPGLGALTGGLTGGILAPASGIAGGLGESLGIGTTAADIGLGAAVGAGTSAAFGKDPLGGAAGGALSGFLASPDSPFASLTGSSSTGPTDTTVTGSPAPAVSPTTTAPTAGTATPVGAGGAAASSLSASGGALPAGSLGSDLTTGIESITVPGIAGGISGISGVAGGLSGATLGNLSGNSAAPVNLLASSGNITPASNATNSTSSNTSPSGDLSGNIGGAIGTAPVGTVSAPTITPTVSSANDVFGASDPVGLNAEIAAGTGVAPGTASGVGNGGKGLFGLGSSGTDLLLAGALGLGGLKQNQDISKLLGPLTTSATNTAAQDASLNQAAQQLGAQSTALNKTQIDALTQQAAQLNQQAGQLGQQANTLSAPLLNNAALPAGAQATIDQYVKDASAKVRATYASLGLSGSSMETDALANVSNQAQQQAFNIKNQLFGDSQSTTNQQMQLEGQVNNIQSGLLNQANTLNTQSLDLIRAGMTGAQMNNSLYESIINTQLQQDQNLSQAISNFAAQIMGTPQTNQLTLKVA